MCPAPSTLHEAKDAAVAISITKDKTKHRLLYQRRDARDDRDEAHGAATRVAMDALCDLRADTVVLLGDARMDEGEAGEKLKEWREYEEKKSQNLVRVPKSLDGKKRKGAGRPPKSKC